MKRRRQHTPQNTFRPEKTWDFFPARACLLCRFFFFLKRWCCAMLFDFIEFFPASTPPSAQNEHQVDFVSFTFFAFPRRCAFRLSHFLYLLNIFTSSTCSSHVVIVFLFHNIQWRSKFVSSHDCMHEFEEFRLIRSSLMCRVRLHKIEGERWLGSRNEKKKAK